MDLFRLVYWMGHIVPKLENLDGYVFIDKNEVGIEKIRSEATTAYSSLREAQSWMNIILLDAFISEAAGDEWASDDPLIDQLLAIFKEVWIYKLGASFPGLRFTIEKVVDDEYGDLGLRLVQLY